MQLRRTLTANAPFSCPEESVYARRPRQADRTTVERHESAGDVVALFLQSKVLELEEELDQASRCSVGKFVGLIGKIHDISQRLFPGPVSMEYAADPEDPSNEYIVFDVVAEGRFSDYRDREFQWHDEVEEIAPGMTTEFRLCVHPKS